MTDLHIQPVDEKHIRIGGIAPVLAVMLRELPEILEMRDSPDARERLFPKPTRANDKINKEWQQMVNPELRHLFVSAGETVTRDLTALVVDEEEAEAYQVDFPIEHVRAWMSALNQARLILGEVHQINEEDMNYTDFDPQNPKHMAALRIHLLGYLLQLFVELETGDEPENPI
jgi:Domain of unknown function (DUF2017)